jgi:hypothetical protein
MRKNFRIIVEIEMPSFKDVRISQSNISETLTKEGEQEGRMKAIGF